MGTKYLYGASVQGIQSFIFQTNKLKEIVGASELVDKICTTEFEEFAQKGTRIIGAAGNIKHIFDSKEDCEKAVLDFPKKIMEAAPGITISQAVVLIESESNFGWAVEELERRLKVQKNKPVRSMTLGLTAIKRAPSTGSPAVDFVKTDLVDEASLKKIKQSEIPSDLAEKAFGESLNNNEIAYEIDKIAGHNNWIAVIHADGNGLGSIIQQIGKNETDLQQFSSKLDEITKKAAQDAFLAIGGKERFINETIPIRPVILGGDDLTLICRADFAVEYTEAFLMNFEEESKKQLEEIKWTNEDIKKVISNGLTACAGIAFVKTTYPFHYAVNLAEDLCKRAKKEAKKIDDTLAPSCLMFHKIQDSFAEDFNEIVKRELMPQPHLSFEFGPYYCGEHSTACDEKCNNTVKKLLEETKSFDDKDGNAVKSNLRQWLGLLSENVDAANQKMKRIRSVNDQARKFIDEKYEKISDQEMSIPFYDMLSLASLTIETKRTVKEKSAEGNQ